MSYSPIAESTDGMERLAVHVFSRLTQAALRETADQPTLERHLWRLPELATHFVFNVITDEHKRQVENIVHRLRVEAGVVINARLDRTAAKRALADRLEQARREFIFRSWRPDDAPRLAAFLDKRQLWEGLIDEYPGPITEALANTLIAISNGWSERHFVNAVEWQGQVIGQVRLQFDSSPFRDSAEVSYWFGEPYWGRGFATRVVTRFTAESFRERPWLQRIFAVVLEGNQASMHVLEKSGFRHESFRYHAITKSGSKRSVHVFGICRADWEP